MTSWPSFSNEEVQAVTNVLHSGKVNYWTGEHGRLFEKEFASYIGVDHAIAVANGTVALELALLSLGVGRGDEVIVPSRTFVATASAVIACGAIPVFADVDLLSQNISVQTIDQVKTDRTKAIIAVHLAGWPCEMDLIMDYAGHHNLVVIEDCAQAHGAKYKGINVGAWGHMAAFSFCQDKIMTTGGEGGMVTTSDNALWKKAWSYKDHGKNYDKVVLRHNSPGFSWLHDSFGTNWRMTEMQASIGRIQLSKLDGWVTKRRELAEIYNRIFSNHQAFRVQYPPTDSYHAYYKYYVFLNTANLPGNFSRDDCLVQMTKNAIPCSSGSCSEIYLEKCFGVGGLLPSQRRQNARQLGETSLMLEVHPTLTADDVAARARAVVNTIQKVNAY